MFPDFNEDGDLPVAIHAATLTDVLARFGKDTAQRQSVARRLERIHHLANATGFVARFIVFGSFVTDKTEPNDVDIVMIMEDAFDPEQLTGELKLLFDHAKAQAHFGASVFWLRRFAIFGEPEVFVADWQVKRNRQRRGIVEIIPEAT